MLAAGLSVSAAVGLLGSLSVCGRVEVAALPGDFAHPFCVALRALRTLSEEAVLADLTLIELPDLTGPGCGPRGDNPRGELAADIACPVDLTCSQAAREWS